MSLSRSKKLAILTSNVFLDMLDEKFAVAKMLPPEIFNPVTSGLSTPIRYQRITRKRITD